MMRRTEMKPGDAVLAKEAEVLLTIGGRRYKWATLTNFELKYNVKTKEVPAVGMLVYGRKPTGADIQWSATHYKVDSSVQDVVQTYLETGVMPTITIQCTNDDPAAAELGRSTVVANDCIIDGDVLLAKAAGNDDFIEQSISGYARSVSFPEKQTTPGYML